jgi:glycerol-3-phosphate cytidylyltransferase
MSKKIIGYTCGVYDLYHVGHIRILENAKKKCDFLIVGLSTDELSLTKGKKPIYKYDDRKEILLSNRNVDSVIPQVTFDKYEAWKEVKFHKLFVGDDWLGHPDWIKYEELLSKHNVQVVYTPYTKSISSSSIRQSLKDS